MAKIKLGTQEQHDYELATTNFKELFEIECPNWFEDVAIANGWHCANCKLKAMLENYVEGKETGDWKNLPYESE